MQRPSRFREPAALSVAWLHALGLTLWVHTAPQGFALGSLRFLTHTALPGLVILLVLATTALRLRGRRTPLLALAVALGAAWAGLALTLALAFPVSAPKVIGPLLVLGAISASPGLGGRAPSRWLAALGGLAVGALAAQAQVPLPPSTRALGVVGAPALKDVPSLGPDEPATIALSCGGLEVELEPTLELGPASRDGFWPILELAYAPAVQRRLSARQEGQVTRVVATSTLQVPAWTHLASFARLRAKGHGPLSLSFSAAPLEVNPQPFDSPQGRPLQLAFVQADRAFVVAEARSAEKGPFRTLARGSLPSSAPLTMRLFERGRPVCQISFDDFAAQLSTAPSPTAGWGLPVNAIELARDGERPDDAISVVFSLAASSVGLGWDAVGTSAGTYVDRVELEPLVAAGPESRKR